MATRSIIKRVGQKLRMRMLAHAAEEAPREACGLLVRYGHGRQLAYKRCRNLHPGTGQFVMDPLDYAAAEDGADEVMALVHSHPHSSANPSMADRAMCERSGLPWLVLGWPSEALVEVLPEGWSAPLEGREFSFGVLDCYTLIQDWYRVERQVELPDFEREDGFYLQGQRADGTVVPARALYRDNLAAAGFEVVNVAEPQRGDVLLMRIGSPVVENHGAVYLGDGMMLHHLHGQLSRRERWDWPWQRRTAAIARFVGLPA